MGYVTRRSRVELHAILLLACVVPFAALADAATSFSDGAHVEVREGDSWSGASILKHEGRKYLVHYEGADTSTDEWVTADRIRLPGSAPATNPASAPQTRPAAKPPIIWNIGDRIEVKWGGLWRKAAVVNKRGEWYLINYEPGPFREWVEPWRLRKPGSNEDTIGYAQPNPMINKGEGPPTEKPAAAPESAAVGAAPAGNSTPAPDLTEVDRSGMRVINVSAGLQSAGFEPDAEEKTAKPIGRKSLALKPCSFFESITGCILPAPGTTTATLVRTDRDPGRSSVQVRADRVDLATGQSVGGYKLPANCQVLDCLDDAGLVATCSDMTTRPDHKGRIEIWEFSASDEAKHLISFVPMDNQEGFREIDAARFIDRDHLLVHGFWGRMSLWEFRKARCIWSIEPKDSRGVGVGFGISASRKYVAAFVGDRITVAEMLTGKPMVSLSAHGAVLGSLSFTPDGAQLAAAGPDLLMVWDLKTGKLQYDLSPVGASGWSIAWPAEGYVLLDHQKLVSLEKQVIVWTYTTQNSRPDMSGMFAGRFWYVISDVGLKTLALCSATIPDEAATRAAASVDTDAQMVIHPGLRVSLDVNVPADAREHVIASLTAKLKDNGMTVADGEPIKLVARIEPGESRAMKYSSMMGHGGNPTTISVQDIKGRLAFESSDGKVLWERRAVTTAPPSLWLKEGQTLQQAIADAMKPPLGLFESGRIPQHVPKNSNGFGSSELSSTGVAAAGSH